MASIDDRVREQYEAYPYPHRDPRDEKHRLVEGTPSDLDEVRHYVYGGRLDLGRPFRALVAGGGTGDAAIMLAQHLASAGAGDAEVVYLDMSAASRRIAEARAVARGLANMRFVTGALEEVAALAPGPYDYIDCCGVLHHLASPEAGLRALASQLARTGGLGLMLYGTYGRSGVYPVQEALAQLVDDLPDAERLAAAHRLIAGLPDTHLLKRNPLVHDHRKGKDAHLYDLLLHRRDRSYRVPELAALLSTAGLAPLAWLEPARYAPRPISPTRRCGAGRRRCRCSIGRRWRSGCPRRWASTSCTPASPAARRWPRRIPALTGRCWCCAASIRRRWRRA